MIIKLKLFASLAGYMPEKSDEEHFILEIKENSSVNDLLADLGVPLDRVKLVFVNGIHAKMGKMLKDGDRVGVFPPVAGG